MDKDCILHTHLCYHPEMQLQIHPDWNAKRIRTIWDILSPDWIVMNPQEIGEYYHVKTNFLEYGRVLLIGKRIIEGKKIV